MRERLTAIIAIILLLILIAASYWYAMQASFNNLRYIPSENSPDFVASEATVISFNEQGIAKTRLEAEQFRHYSNDTIMMVKPKATTISPNEPITHAEALKGSSTDAGETFQFEGDVVVSRAASGNTAATRLETQSMTVYTDTNRFESDDVVDIFSGEDRARGTGMVFDNLSRTVELKSRVTTVIEPRNNSKNLLR